MKAVRLPSQDQHVRPGTMGYVSGWGTMSSKLPVSTKTLRAVEVPVISNALCQRRYSTVHITPRMFCAGYRFGGKDACQVCNSCSYFA